MNKTEAWKVQAIPDNKVNRTIWEEISPLKIDNFPWDENGYKPQTEAQILYTETRLYLLFKSYENKIRAECLNMNDPVCTDSCVEFFFNPDPEHDRRYMNFEINPIGTLLLGIGEDRHSRTLITEVSPEIFSIKPSINRESINDYQDPVWSVEFSIPFSFIEQYYGKQQFHPGKRMKANFYKCGDKTQYPHFGCWNRIENPTPDFHRPEFFGDLELGRRK